MGDYDMNGFRINTLAKKYEPLRVINLVTITSDGLVLR